MKDNAIAQQTMREIVGEKVSAVVFGVFGQLSFQVGGASLVAQNTVSLKTGERILRFGETGFCDALCSQLGQVVLDVQISDDELRIAIGGESLFAMSLREADYSGPEARTYNSADKRMMVFT